MRIWIEVSSGDSAWIKKLESDQNLRRGLKAPANTRYLNLLKPVSRGDIILTHLTTSLTKNKNWRSSIVGISMVDGEQHIIKNAIHIQLINSVELPISIKFFEYKEMRNFSEQFKLRISSCLQRYLIEITPKDFSILLSIHPENIDFLAKTIYSSILETII